MGDYSNQYSSGTTYACKFRSCNMDIFLDNQTLTDTLLKYINVRKNVLDKLWNAISLVYDDLPRTFVTTHTFPRATAINVLPSCAIEHHVNEPERGRTVNNYTSGCIVVLEIIRVIPRIC